MKTEEIKQAVEEYFKEMLAKDADYLDNVTDSWIDDAEDWFVENYENKNVSFEEGCEFRQHARKRFDEIYHEKYDERDAKYCLRRISNVIKTLHGNYNSIKHYFKKFNTCTELVAYKFEELEKCLQLLDDIENNKVESLKEKIE